MAVVKSISKTNIAWAAGFLDGEGCFSFYKNRKGSINFQVDAGQMDDWPLRKLTGILGGQVHLIRNSNHGNMIWKWYASGARARGIMMTLFSFLSPRRQEKIKLILSLPWSLAGKYKTKCKAGHDLSRRPNAKRRICRICQRTATQKHRFKRRLIEVADFLEDTDVSPHTQRVTG